MPDPIYFQWQNEYLLRTIYPLREMKLRDFLQFFYEIDLWQEYKGKQASAIDGEVQAFRTAQKAKILAAYDRYQQLEAYFFVADVTDTYRTSFQTPDTGVMTQINELHKTFLRFFPTYKNPAKEKYFISARVREMEELQKRYLAQLKQKQRALRNNGPIWAGKTACESEITRLTTAMKMIEQELSQLVAFAGAYERLYTFKMDVQKQRGAQVKELTGSESRLQGLRTELDTLQNRLGPIQSALKRMKTPPNMQALKTYFMDEAVNDIYRQKIGDPDPAVLKVIHEAHRSFKTIFPTYNNVQKEKFFIAQRLADLERLRKLKQQELASATRLSNTANMAALKKTLQMLDEEVGKLTDYQWAYDNLGKPASQLSAQIAQAEKEQADVQSKIRTIQGAISTQETAIGQSKAAVSVSDKDWILASIDAAPVQVSDIVRNKIDDYRNSLVQKDLNRLLEEVVQEFMRQPTRYPLWLQYMVIHFSGMRYQSAHGSWADPKDMLLALRIRAIEQNLRRAGEDAIRVMSEERFSLYQTAGSAPDVDGPQARIPALLQTKDPYWKKRIEQHVKALDPAKWYNKFKALLDVQIDEEDFEIQQLKDPEALSQLEDMKDQLPEWMWNEIVRSTNLRLTQVKQAGWEQLTTEEMEQQYAAGMAPYREILTQWKKVHLTGWREEHERTNQLIVTRAVCNEVAEHIQHLRGRKPSGGLTAKPEWYLRNEKDPRLAHLPDKPCFIKPKAATDFRPGASLFWLGWVNKEPNIWQITRPITLRNGEELILPLRDAQAEITNTGNAFQRKMRFQERDANGNLVERQSQQWLRWLHEATVVEMAETVDGPVVLTFETALPGEDRRQSTIGVFKRYAADLKYNVTASLMNGTFVGYIPEGAVPYDDLRDMLNWNHILLRNAYAPAEMDQYWQQVEKPIDPSIAFAMQMYYPESLAEAAPRLRRKDHKEWITCYELNPETDSLALYQPSVELRRGTRMMVSKDQCEHLDGENYTLVTACEYEPRAEGLYVRASELIDVTGELSARLVKARKQTPLYRLTSGDEQDEPVFENGPLSVKAGTRLLISTVHKISSQDTGDGAVRGQRKQRYYLILSCPAVPTAEGLFIRLSDQRKVPPAQGKTERG